MQKTPNHTAVLILGIVSYIGCCFTYGILGIIMSAIGIVMANKDIKLGFTVFRVVGVQDCH